MMARPTDIAKRATAASRSKGGRARAAALRAKSEEERRLRAESRRDRLDGAIERLAELAEKAADTIGALLDDAESESVRLRAAVSLLEILDAAELGPVSFYSGGSNGSKTRPPCTAARPALAGAT